MPQDTSKNQSTTLFVTIRSLTGKEHKIGIDPQATVYDLKKAFSDALCESKIDRNLFSLAYKTQVTDVTPPENMRFVYFGKALENHRTLADYGVQNKSKMFVVYRLRGKRNTTQPEEGTDSLFKTYSITPTVNSNEKRALPIQLIVPKDKQVPAFFIYYVYDGTPDVQTRTLSISQEKLSALTSIDYSANSDGSTLKDDRLVLYLEDNIKIENGDETLYITQLTKETVNVRNLHFAKPNYGVGLAAGSLCAMAEIMSAKTLSEDALKRLLELIRAFKQQCEFARHDYYFYTRYPGLLPLMKEVDTYLQGPLKNKLNVQEISSNNTEAPASSQTLSLLKACQAAMNNAKETFHNINDERLKNFMVDTMAKNNAKCAHDFVTAFIQFKENLKNYQKAPEDTACPTLYCRTVVASIISWTGNHPSWRRKSIAFSTRFCYDEEKEVDLIKLKHWLVHAMLQTVQPEEQFNMFRTVWPEIDAKQQYKLEKERPWNFEPTSPFSPPNSNNLNPEIPSSSLLASHGEENDNVPYFTDTDEEPDINNTQGHRVMRGGYSTTEYASPRTLLKLSVRLIYGITAASALVLGVSGVCLGISTLGLGSAFFLLPVVALFFFHTGVQYAAKGLALAALAVFFVAFGLTAPVLPVSLLVCSVGVALCTAILAVMHIVALCSAASKPAWDPLLYIIMPQDKEKEVKEQTPFHSLDAAHNIDRSSTVLQPNNDENPSSDEQDMIVGQACESV